MKGRLLCSTALTALVMLFLPWLAVSFARGDAGMAICFLLFYSVDPVYAIAVGWSAGKELRRLWMEPIITATLFLLGAWCFFDRGELLFVLYGLVYLLLGTGAMLLSAWLFRRR